MLGMFIMFQTPPPLDLPHPALGHGIYDIAVSFAVAVLASIKGIELARKYGLLPESESRSNPGSAKTVGRLHLESLHSILRHEIRDQMQPLVLKMSEYNAKQLDKLEDINLSVREVATMLRERK